MLFALDVEAAEAGAYTQAAFDAQCAELTRFSAKVRLCYIPPAIKHIDSSVHWTYYLFYVGPFHLFYCKCDSCMCRSSWIWTQTIPRDSLRFVPIVSASAANVWRAADFSSAVADHADYAAAAAILGAELGMLSYEGQ